MKAAPELEQHDAEVDRIRALFKERQVDAAPPDLIKFSISSKASQDITRGIGSGLAKNPDRGLNG